MAFGGGKDQAFKLDNVDDTLTDISQYVTSVSFTHSAETIDVTRLGQTTRAFVKGLIGASIDLEGIWDTYVGTGIFLLGTATTAVDWEYYPQGTASGKTIYSGNCFLADHNPTGGVEDAVTWSASLTVDGAVTVGTV